AFYLSIATLVVLLLIGTWREAFQFTFLPFELFRLEDFIPRAEKVLNGGKSFAPSILTYIYFLILSIVVSRLAVYCYEKVQSRIVRSKKADKDKERASLRYQKVRKHWPKINTKNQKAWRKKQASKG